MEAIAKAVIEVAPESPNEIQWAHLGSGRPKLNCGLLITEGHAVDGEVHARAWYRRCRRAECPECFDKPNGYVDQAQRRIERGVMIETDGRSDWKVAEFVVTPQVPLWRLADQRVRAKVLGRIRDGLREWVLEPVAWTLCHGATALDYCPRDPHFHIFARRQLRAGSPGHEARDLRGNLLEYRRIDDDLRIREMSKPELGRALREMGVLTYTVADSGLRKRVPTVGWYGRRKPRLPFGEVPPDDSEEEPTVVCEVCHQPIARSNWRRCVDRTFRPTNQIAWKGPESSFEWLDGRSWGS